MIATWMLYCSLCALGLTLAATLAERLLLAGRAPVRVVWLGALLLSLGIPLAVFRLSSSASAVSFAPRVEIAPANMPLNANAELPATVRVAAATPQAKHWTAAVADRLRELDSPLMIAWLVLSAALAVSFLTGIVGLAWMRRRWQERSIQDTPVYVSRRTGPAIVGVVSPGDRRPRVGAEPSGGQLALMLRHEREHLAARDGQLLIAAQIALIAMPWNVALWWQVLRLRVAIEMDCDARVLRVADARIVRRVAARGRATASFLPACRYDRVRGPRNSVGATHSVLEASSRRPVEGNDDRRVDDRNDRAERRLGRTTSNRAGAWREPHVAAECFVVAGRRNARCTVDRADDDAGGPRGGAAETPSRNARA